MVHIALDWKRIDWRPSDTWAKNIDPRLKKQGLTEAKLKRSVYVIRLNGNYCVEYPKGTSPTLYIGEGNFRQRIGAHKEWLSELEEFVGEFSFQVRIAIPRVNNRPTAYQDCEAAVIIRFGELFGSAPLWNKQFENRRHENYEYDRRQVDSAIRKGSGTNYKRAFRPMVSSPFHDDFQRTHL